MKHQKRFRSPHHWVGLLATVIIVPSIFVIGLSLSSEPHYHGRTLTRWLGDRPTHQNTFLTQSAPISPEAQHAIKTIGTNAVPILLEMIQARDSAFKTWLNSTLNRQRIIEFRFRSVAERHAMAFAGFEILREDAKGAAPALASLIADPDAGVRYGALESLRRVTTDKNLLVPLLLQACRDPEPGIRFIANTDLHFRSPESLRITGIPDILDDLHRQGMNDASTVPPQSN